MNLTGFTTTLDRLAAADKFTGSVAVTADAETIFSGAYGFASRTWRAPATVDTRYDTASITKLFTAVATLQQVEPGAFALDTPVIDYLRGLPGPGRHHDLPRDHPAPPAHPYLRHRRRRGRRGRGGRLVGPALTAELLRPHARHHENHMMEYAFEHDLAADGTIMRYGKEGVNVGTLADSCATTPTRT